MARQGRDSQSLCQTWIDMVQRRRGVGVENSQVTGLLIANDSKASRLRQSDFDRLTSLEWDGMG